MRPRRPLSLRVSQCRIVFLFYYAIRKVVGCSEVDMEEIILTAMAFVGAICIFLICLFAIMKCRDASPFSPDHGVRRRVISLPHPPGGLHTVTRVVSAGPNGCVWTISTTVRPPQVAPKPAAAFEDKPPSYEEVVSADSRQPHNSVAPV